MTSDRETNIDFCIITALEVERKAVCEIFRLGDKDRVRVDGRIYWRGRLDLGGGAFYELAVAQSPDMANLDAALLTAEGVVNISGIVRRSPAYCNRFTTAIRSPGSSCCTSVPTCHFGRPSRRSPSAVART
jgi:hypothetical protein